MSIKSEEFQSFKELVIFHCAPTLNRLKVGSMFHLKVDDYSRLDEMLQIFNNYYQNQIIFKKIIVGNRITIFVYNRISLTCLLKKQEIRYFLKQFGYKEIFENIDDDINFLIKRLNYDCYPHEIGIFLGYPLDDVKHFINNDQCLYIGYWKVYSNEKGCKKLFSIFDESKRKMMIEKNQFLNG